MDLSQKEKKSLEYSFLLKLISMKTLIYQVSYLFF
jgi:hypothetical protein